MMYCIYFTHLCDKACNLLDFHNNVTDFNRGYRILWKWREITV